jgi:hypothetical protein
MEDISLGWRGLTGTNTLAYYENPKITAIKSLIVQAPGAIVIKQFRAVSYESTFCGEGQGLTLG